MLFNQIRTMASGRRPTGLEQYLLESSRETGVEFGRGSYASVVEVEFKGLRCAGKKIHDIFYEGRVETLVSKFVEECRLLSQLRHPHIVQFLGTCIDVATKAPVLVMEYLPITLNECLERYGVMPEEIGYSVLRDVGLGLHFLHDRHDPIIHRDLSANNVLLSTDMQAKISDLGVAKILQDNPANLSTMTKAPGTQSYMAPEALSPTPRYNVKVDIFSYGVMMIHVLSGKWPMPSEAVHVDPDNPDVLTAVSEFDRRNENIKMIREDNPLMSLIKRCLNNSPNHRPTSKDVRDQTRAVANEHLPSYANRIELLRKMRSLERDKELLNNENKKLQDEKDDLIGERETLMAQNQSLADDNEDLSHQLQTTSLSTSFSVSTELEMLQSSISDHRSEITHLQGLLELKEIELSEAERQHRDVLSGLEQQVREEKSILEQEHRSDMHSTLRRHTSEKAVLEEEIEKLKQESRDKRESQFSTLEDKHRQEMSRLERKYQLQLETKVREMASKDEMLTLRARTIESLGEQLKQTLATSNQRGGQAHVFSPGSTLLFKETKCLPAPMFYITSTIIGSYLYAGGGFGGSRTADENVERSVYRYSITDDTWSSPLPPAPVVKFGIAQVSGRVVLVGGRPKPSRVVANIYMYNEETKDWILPSTVPPMPTARSSLTTITWKSPAAILACGGFDKNFNPQTCVEIYHQKSGQWHSSCPLPFPRAIATYTSIGNTVYIVGGYKNNSAHGYTRSVTYTSVPALLKYQQHQKKRTASSSSEESAPDEMWKMLPEVPNFFTSAASIGGCLLVVGGQSESLGATSCIKSVYVYCPSSPGAISWHSVSELPHACTMCATAALPTGELLVMGGCTNNGLVNRVCRGQLLHD